MIPLSIGISPCVHCEAHQICSNSRMRDDLENEHDNNYNGDHASVSNSLKCKRTQHTRRQASRQASKQREKERPNLN